MTHPALNAFLDRLSEDEDLYDRVEKAVRGQADTAAATVEFAGSIGFDFSRDELQAALRERYLDRELTDQQLEAVAGGTLSTITLGGGLCLAFPDVCKTPSPGSPVAVPYPSTATASDTTQAGKTVKG